MPIMIWIAIIIEVILACIPGGESTESWIDAAVLLFIQFANATLGWYETVKAADAVAALKASLKPLATVKRDGIWLNMDATAVVPGDLVLLGAGAAVPADCIVNEGRIEVDQSALTGESMPVTMYKGDTPKMGSTITRGEVEGTIEFTGPNTFFGKTATLLQGNDGLGNLQKIILKIMWILVGLSVVMCITVLIYLLAEGNDAKNVLSFVVVLLVASIPIAIEIVCTTTLALGSRQLSKYGAIVSRLQAIEEMAGMNMLCSDKTGTLTLNKMEIQDYCPVFSPDVAADKQAVVQYAALAAKWKEPPKDALDTMTLGACDLAALDAYTMLDHQPFDPTLKRTESTIKGPDGEEFLVTKGAPQIIDKLVGDSDLHDRIEAEVHNLGSRGIRSLAVARTAPGNKTKDKWVMLGLLTFLDPPRPDTKSTIEACLENGVDVKMITGDQVLIAKEMSRILGLGTNISDATGLPSMEADGNIPSDLGEKYGQMIIQADGFAQVYPEHKYLIVEALRQAGFAVGMTGDGVNDAPALKRADVGIAVSGSTDAARAAADIILTEPGLGVVIHAIVVARQIFQRVKNFLNYRIAATLQLLIFFFISVFLFDPEDYFKAIEKQPIKYSEQIISSDCWYPYTIDPAEAAQDPELQEYLNKAEDDFTHDCPTFFQLPVILLILITVLNDGTLIAVGYDNVKASPWPEKWNLRVLFLVSSVLGFISMGSSLLLVWAALESPNDGSLFQEMGLPVPDYGQITMMIYLKVSLSDFLTLFSARSNPGFFWETIPAIILLGAAMVALGISTLIACLWPEGHLGPVPVEGLTQDSSYTLWPLWIWCFCLVFFLLQDLLKVITYWVVYKYDIFQARTGALVNVRTAFQPSDQPIAAEATGMVEKKLLDRKVQGAIDAVDKITRTSLGGVAPPALARVSQTLGMTRTSMTPVGQVSSQPLPSQVVDDLAAAAGQVAPFVSESDNAEIQKRVAGVQDAAARLGRVSAVLAGSAAEAAADKDNKKGKKK